MRSNMLLRILLILIATVALACIGPAMGRSNTKCPAPTAAAHGTALPDGLKIVDNDAYLAIRPHEPSSSSGTAVAPVLRTHERRWPEDLSITRVERWTGACIFISVSRSTDTSQYVVRLDDDHRHLAADSAASYYDSVRVFESGNQAREYVRRTVIGAELLDSFSP